MVAAKIGHPARGRAAISLGPPLAVVGLTLESGAPPGPRRLLAFITNVAAILARQGLFEVTDGIYQVGGYDLSNMSVIEGDTGIIVIDPLISAETAAAALALYRKHRGDRPVVAVIHTHSHVDHFGGVKGVVSQDDVDDGTVQVIAPEGFVEHAISENVYAGPAMARRAPQP